MVEVGHHPEALEEEAVRYFQASEAEVEAQRLEQVKQGQIQDLRPYLTVGEEEPWCRKALKRAVSRCRLLGLLRRRLRCLRTRRRTSRLRQLVCFCSYLRQLV